MIDRSRFLDTYEDTRLWLDSVNISSCDINRETLLVDCNFGIWLEFNQMKQIPVKFNNVFGSFNVSYCRNLKSLIGSPNKTKTISCNNTSIDSFVGLGDVDCVIASDIDTLSSFNGLPTTLSFLNIDGSCNNITSLLYFPKIIKNSLHIGSDFRFSYCLYRHSIEINKIVICGDVNKFYGIVNLLNVGGVNAIEIAENIKVESIMSEEIKRQPNPKKRNILKVSQELSNAGFHHLTVI